MNVLITFRSITYAQKAGSILEHGGIRASLMRAPLILSSEGCGYALRLRQNRLNDALTLLRASSMRFLRVWEEKEDGTYTEIRQ